MKKRFNIDRDRLRKTAQQALSPAFLIILFGSFLLWYTSKLSYDYTTSMPLSLRIDGQKYKVTAEVYGRGSDLMAQKLSLSSKINVKFDELSPKASEENSDSFTLSEKNLLEVLNSRIKGLRVNRIIEAPEFTPIPEKETRKERRARLRMEIENEDLIPVPIPVE